MHNILGKSSECSIQINNRDCVALLDTGSNVSTLAQSKYIELFPDIPVKPLCDFSLDIGGAGGQQLPYSGYVEVNLSVSGLFKDISCLMLVVPDTRYAQRVPVILGTNILTSVMERLEEHYGVRYLQKADLHS